MAISRQQLVKELEPGLNALFGLEYNRYDNEHAEIFFKHGESIFQVKEIIINFFWALCIII